MAEYKKREIAYKLKIGDILAGTPVVEDISQESLDPNQTTNIPLKERFRFLELGNKKVVRINVIANIVDKYTSEGEKRFSTITIDDGTGQIRLKVFGDDIKIFNEFSQGDSVIVIGVLRSFNRELYVLPEIIKKVDPKYLLIRKLELEKASERNKEKAIRPEQALQLREQIIEMIKSGEQSNEGNGVSTENIILKIKTSSPEAINSEIVKLIEDGIIYEPRPGRVRYLG